MTDDRFYPADGDNRYDGQAMKVSHPHPDK